VEGSSEEGSVEVTEVDLEVVEADSKADLPVVVTEGECHTQDPPLVIPRDMLLT